MGGRYGELQDHQRDFVVRHRPFFVPLMFIFLVAFAIIYITGITSHQGQGQIIFALTLMIVIGALSWFTVAYTRRQRDLVLLAEYQNTIFASAVGVGSQFTMIVKTEGAIVYIDPGLQQIFPDLDYRRLKHIEQFFELSGLPDPQREAINRAFAERSNSHTQIDLEMPDKRVITAIITVNPLPRPAGYFLLRGREYVPRPQPKIAMTATNVQISAANNTQPLDYNYALEQFITYSPIAAACLDQYGVVIFCNNALQKLLGRTKHRQKGWQFAESLSAESKEQFTKSLQNLFANQDGASALEVKIGEEDKVDASIYMSKIPISATAEEEENRCLLYMLDMTEQKELEVKYAHSQKMQAVGQLAGGVAHDFNNLLTAMIGFCDLLLMRHPAGDASFADIMQIKQNANRAANLVRQLLAFSRRQTLQPKMLALTDVLAELSNLIRRLIGENIELKMVHGREVSHVKADQGQLEQVFINLAVNARDAMKENGGTLTIRTSVVTIKNKWDLASNLVAPSDEDAIEPGEYVLVEMEDSGHGIPASEIHKIFEPFYSTKKVGEGTGLGLATVYGIIKQTGGYLYVASEEGVGTCFHIYFPHHVAEEVSQPQRAETSKAEGDLSGMGTILLVEDEAPVRGFAARALRNKGYEVLEADCGEAALEIMEEHGEDLQVIVSDVIMPGMNGPEMIKQIMPKYPNVKVIFISGYAEDAFADSFGEDVEFNFLPKPFTLKQLASKIKEVTASSS